MFNKKFIFSKIGFLFGIAIFVYFAATDSSGLNEGDLILVSIWGLFVFIIGLTLVGLAIDGLIIIFKKIIKKTS